jgi:hypothetical protein
MYPKKNSKNPDPEYYNREVKWLKEKVRKAYNTRKFGQHYQADVNRLSKELLVAKKKAQETYIRLVLQKEGRCWIEFCKYVKRRKGNRENIPVIKDQNGKFFTEPLEKANALNSYFVYICSCKRNNPHIQLPGVGKPFIASINSIRKRLFSSSREKEILRPGWHSWGNFKLRRGSHDSISREIAGYNDEQ